MDFNNIVKVAERAALFVGKRIAEVVSEKSAINIEYKGETNLVTEIDIWSEKEVEKAIKENFPDHVLVGEETSSELEVRSGKSLEEIYKDEICWFVDPIDGTTNFANGIPHVAVSLGITVKGERVAGIIYEPCQDRMYVAVKGQGATCNGKKLAVSPKTELIQSVVATGFPYDRIYKWSLYTPLFDALVKQSRALRVLGAACLDECFVASGRLDAFVEYNLKSWDVCAGSLIVEEAGGRIANFAEPEGKEFSIFSHSFLFSCPGIFKTVLDISSSIDREARAQISNK